MTAKELIEVLSKVPPDTSVITVRFSNDFSVYETIEHAEIVIDRYVKLWIGEEEDAY